MTRLARISQSALVMLGIIWGDCSEVAAEISASDWQVTEYGQIRLISGVTAVGDKVSVPLGIQIKLKPEWKTYWRSPGESGIPPGFNWSQSRNLAKTEIYWPAPGRYTSFGLDTIGYKNEVVFPITAQVEVPGQAVSAIVNVDYAVCRDICVPLQTRLHLQIPAGDRSSSEHTSLIQQFTGLVPTVAGERTDASGPILKDLHISDVTGTEFLTAVVRRPPAAENYDLFVEAGDDFGFGSPTVKVQKDLNEIEFDVPVYRFRKNADLSAVPVSLTFVAGISAIVWSRTLSSD